MSELVAVMMAVVALAFLTTPALSRKAEHSAPLLPRSEMLKVVGAGHVNLIADFYWIQTVQAVGKARTAAEYRDIFYYADLTTTLDPDFEIVYRFAGAAIPHNLGRETWVNTAESTALLEKGLKRFPDQLFLRILLAFNLSYFQRDFARAGEVLEQATKLPGAPRYLGALVTRLFAKGGRMESALDLAHSMYEAEEDPDTKAVYEKRIVQLESERLLQQVDAAIATYRDRAGSLPVSLTQLVGEGLLPQVLLDPMGGTIFIDEKGSAQTTASARMEVKTEASGP